MSKIVLVEDEVIILETTREMLELLGYDVRAVSTGAETLRFLATEEGGADLVILDLSLPDMDGRQLVRQLAGDYPRVRIIICSGSQPDEREFSGIPSVKGLLNKPFGMKELEAIVLRTLEKSV